MKGTERFIDTNVLLYLLSSDDAKADRAEETLAGFVGLDDRCGRVDLADGHQLDVVCVSACFRAGSEDLVFQSSDVFCDAHLI